jgi:hypothetical protein
MTRKKWTKPELRSIEVTGEELAAVRASGDPVVELIKLKPELTRGKSER